MKLKFKFFCLFITGVFINQLYSQKGYDVERKAISIGSFKTLSVYSGIEVILIPSDRNIGYIYGDNIENVIINIKRESLKIKRSVKSIFETGYNFVEIYFNKNIESIRAFQGSIISVKKTIKQDNLNIRAKEGAKVSLKLDIKKHKATVTSGAKISYKGFSDEINLKVSTGGIINAEKLSTQIAKVKVIAGGFASIKVEKFADLNVTAGGKIEVYGKAEKIITKHTLGGRIFFK